MSEITFQTPAADTTNTAAQVVQRLLQLPALVAQNADLVRRGRCFSGDVELGIGPRSLIASIVEGRVQQVDQGPFLLRCSLFAVRMEPETWIEFLRPFPRPGWHDLLALSKRGAARIEGNLQPFMANLQYVKDVLAAARAPVKD